MTFIAHSGKDGRLQTVEEHLSNVSRYSADFGKSVGISALTKLAGSLHDMGKYNEAFQIYIKSAITNMRNGTPEKNHFLKKVDHGRIGAMLVYRKYHALGGYSALTAEILAMAICYHHGGLHDYLSFGSEKSYSPLLERMHLLSDDPAFSQCEECFYRRFLSEQAMDQLFAEARAELERLDVKFKGNKSERFFWFHLLIKQIYSVLIDADRLDTQRFMDNLPPYKGEMLPPWEMYSNKLERQMFAFRMMTTASPLEEKIKTKRLQISDRCKEFAGCDSGVYTLTVPTGGGKTFSSLRFALNHAKIKNKKRILYVLPYTTIIEQNAAEVRRVLDCGDHLLEHHSNVIPENDDYRLLTERWDCPIIFTTTVQFLDTIYAGGTGPVRRFHQLSDAIIIFDEIQAIPIKCISLFNSAINYLSKICNSTMILCSATQPTLGQTRIPLLLSPTPEIMENPVELCAQLKRMTVVDQRISSGYSIQMVGDFIARQKEKVSSVLVVVNTKSVAEKTFIDLKSRNFKETPALFYLSTNLCPAHRKKIITDMKCLLAQQKPLVCVSTQLIEAGVDISFDAVIRSLSGLDSIAQATGRGNRHGKNQEGYSYLINIADEHLGNLDEIRLGAIHSAEVLNEFKKSPSVFHGNLLSPLSIQKYFDYYYGDGEIKEKMDYPVPKQQTSIYEMLTTTPAKRQQYEHDHGSPCELQLNHLFESAGNAFHVIDEDTYTVLVPYGEGSVLIAKLLSADCIETKIRLLRQVQQYSVNIYSSMMRQLTDEKAFKTCEIEGVLILKEGYYEEETGVTAQKNLEFLSL